ncbi:phage portal protein [Pasteurella multocida]|nr:phage portal protein [Pasteurella multocida]HDR1874071.1 phage portal protein [Pasteurella multocida]HDR1894431.1 phage portal protein [Pasteurella multocida]HED4406672.1 phage portal protein [Pasteurella multocida]
MKKTKHKKQSKVITDSAKNSFSIQNNDWEPSLPPAFDYMGIYFNDNHQCYEPPLNRWALAKLPSQNAQHCGILNSRANMISADYVSGCLSKMDMRAACLNLIQFGDVGLLKVRNGFGKVVKLVTLSSLYLRKTKDGNFCYTARQSLFDSENTKSVIYKAHDVVFIKLYDPMQQMYGTPDYIGGIQSALLNSEATIFRRRYFANGSHLGFILYTTDPDITEDMEENIRKSLNNSQGVGNFKSMFVNSPNGHPDGLKLIPVGDTGKKDEFGTIKNISAQDILTAHRYPPGLSGVIPQTGSFGDPLKMRLAYRQDEVLPMQDLIASSINDDREIAANDTLKVQFKQREIMQK